MTGRRFNAFATAVVVSLATAMVCALGCGLLCGGMGWLR